MLGRRAWTIAIMYRWDSGPKLRRRLWLAACRHANQGVAFGISSRLRVWLDLPSGQWGFDASRRGRCGGWWRGTCAAGREARS
jgi:hypothetical protein